MDHRQLFRSKVKWISLFLSVLVVFIHSTNTAGIQPDRFAAHVETLISGNLALAAVPAFFAMSAFLFYQNFDFSKLTEKYKSRFRSLLVPYLFWNAVYMVIFYFLSRLSFINEQPFRFSFPLVLDALLNQRFNMAYWFMQQLILFTILCPLIYTLMRNKFVAWVVYAALLTLYGSGCSAAFYLDMRSLLFYLAGVYLGLHHRRQIMEANRFNWVYPAAFLLSQIVFYSGLTDVNPVLGWLHTALLVVAFWGFGNLIANRELPLPLQCSFEIYTLHILILETFNKLFGFLLPRDSNWILLDYFLSPMLTVGIVVLITQFIRKTMPKFHKFAFGGR